MKILERALLLTLFAHAAGMVSMVLFLLPGMPGGGTVDDGARMAYIASHPWIWRLGWLPWQITAVSDLLVAVALWRTPWVGRMAAACTVVATLAAVIPDQYGQVAWITKGIALASGDRATYLAYEKQIFQSTAVWGAAFYTIGALGWTWCLAAAKVWSRALTLLSFVLWPLFGLATVGPMVGLDAKLVAGANALAFALLELWFLLALRAVFERSRRETVRNAIPR